MKLFINKLFGYLWLRFVNLSQDKNESIYLLNFKNNLNLTKKKLNKSDYLLFRLNIFFLQNILDKNIFDSN